MGQRRGGGVGIELGGLFVVNRSCAGGQFTVVNDPPAVTMIMASKVQEDGMQPGIKARITAKPMNRADGYDKGILHKVLGLGFISAQQKGGTKQPVAVRFDQFSDGSAIEAF